MALEKRYFSFCDLPLGREILASVGGLGRECDMEIGGERRSKSNFASDAFSLRYCLLSLDVQELEVCREDGVKKRRCKSQGVQELAGTHKLELVGTHSLTLMACCPQEKRPFFGTWPKTRT